MSPRLFPPLSLGEILAEIGQLTNAQVDSIAAELREPQLSLSDDARASFVSKKTNIDVEVIEYLFSFVAFVSAELERKASNDDERAYLVESLLADYELADDGRETSIAELKERILRFTARSERSIFHKNAIRLRKGFLRNVRSFSSFVDLRPVMNPDHSEIEGYVTVVQLQIATDRDDEEPTILVQMDEEALSKMMEVALDIRKKIAMLKSRYPVDRI